MNYSNYVVHLNNEKLPLKKVKKIFKSIQNPQIIKEKGGFLFKSSIFDSEFHIGIVPHFINGERTHHYDIKLANENEFAFTGFINSNISMGILFTPPGKKETITKEFKDKLKRSYIDTAELFIHNGFAPDFPIDWITSKIIKEIDIFSQIPETLEQFKSNK